MPAFWEFNSWPVFPSYTSCTGKKWPENAVNGCTHLDPSSCIAKQFLLCKYENWYADNIVTQKNIDKGIEPVNMKLSCCTVTLLQIQFGKGMYLMAVWPQFRNILSGISSTVTIASISDISCHELWQILDMEIADCYGFISVCMCMWRGRVSASVVCLSVALMIFKMQQL